jgi:hypothetical protein
MIDSETDRIIKIIEVCEIHSLRLNESYESIEHLLPLTSEKHQNLTSACKKTRSLIRKLQE